MKTRIKSPSIFKRAQGITFSKVIFTRIAALLITAIAILAISQASKLPVTGELHEGDVSTKDIYAPFSFTYDWGMDAEKTGEAKKNALSQVYDIYTLDLDQVKELQERLRIFFDNVIILQGMKSEPAQGSYAELATILKTPPPQDAVKDITSSKDINKLRQVVSLAVGDILSQPVISEQDKKRLISEGKKAVAIRTEPGKETHESNVAGISLVATTKEELSQRIEKDSEDDTRPVKKALSELLSLQISPNLNYSEKETSLARKAAEESAKPVYIKHEIKKDEIIIFKGERATDHALAKLSAIRAISRKTDIYPFLAGFFMILFLLFFILVIYIKIFEPKTPKCNTCVLLICVLLLLITALTKVIVLSPLPTYFIPAASVSMLYALLIGNTAVFPLLIISGVIITIIAGAELNVFMVCFIGSSVAVFAIKKARHRADLIRTGLYSGLANFVYISTIGFMNALEPAVFIQDGLWGLAAGIFSAGITMVCLPILERALHLTSDIGLLELADLNHPLLKEMASKAPGTYHHSLIVGNLAEAACDAIGANSLLTRVGAYYHDIGKSAKSEYFSENQPKVSTSHDTLTPHMSSLIITNHVKDGVDSAKKYMLPVPIIDMIEQHHGTGLIYYFYQKALETEQEEETVKEEGFRYPGPKPQTKESAVILLADSVEAASRALSEPTPARLEELVRRIVNNKFIDGQLDECELTLKDINIITKSFLKVLVGIYHARVEYPR